MRRRASVAAGRRKREENERKKKERSHKKPFVAAGGREREFKVTNINQLIYDHSHPCMCISEMWFHQRKGGREID